MLERLRELLDVQKINLHTLEKRIADAENQLENVSGNPQELLDLLEVQSAAMTVTIDLDGLMKRMDLIEQNLSETAKTEYKTNLRELLKDKLKDK